MGIFPRRNQYEFIHKKHFTRFQRFHIACVILFKFFHRERVCKIPVFSGETPAGFGVQGRRMPVFRIFYGKKCCRCQSHSHTDPVFADDFRRIPVKLKTSGMVQDIFLPVSRICGPRDVDSFAFDCTVEGSDVVQTGSIVKFISQPHCEHFVCCPEVGQEQYGGSSDPLFHLQMFHLQKSFLSMFYCPVSHFAG